MGCKGNFQLFLEHSLEQRPHLFIKLPVIDSLHNPIKQFILTKF